MWVPPIPVTLVFLLTILCMKLKTTNFIVLETPTPLPPAVPPGVHRVGWTWGPTPPQTLVAGGLVGGLGVGGD